MNENELPEGSRQQEIHKPDKYPISYVSKVLEMKEYSLRYFEKAIGYEVERDENNNRWYTQEDIDNLRYHLGEKSIGYTYPQIRKMREAKGQKIFNEGTSNEESEIVDKEIEKELLPSNQNEIMQAFLRNMQEKLDKLDKLEKMEIELNNIKEINAALVDKLEENIKKEEDRDIRLIERLKELQKEHKEEFEKKEEENKKKKKFFGLFG